MHHRFAVAALTLALGGVPAHSYWPSDPAESIRVADDVTHQFRPLVAATPDGGSYVAWIDHRDPDVNDDTEIRLQLLDSVGAERWPHNGIVLPGYAFDAYSDCDLIADSVGGAVIVCSDERVGTDLDIYAYRIAPDGSFSWGTNGVTLSVNTVEELTPRVVEASDGDFVVVWRRGSNYLDDFRMQRLSPAGEVRFATGGIVVVPTSDGDSFWVGPIAAEDGSVLLSWVSTLGLRARKFSASGQPVWPSAVTIATSTDWKPQVRADGAGGVVLAWHQFIDGLARSFVQHLDANGVPLLAVGGAAVTTAGSHHTDPSPAYDPATGSTIVFWNPRNPLWDPHNADTLQRGLQVQKLSAAGEREWGDEGIELRPVNAAFWQQVFPFGGGAIAVFNDGTASSARVLAVRMAADGSQPWGDAIVISSASYKDGLVAAIDTFGVTRVLWGRYRGSSDIDAQSLRPSGVLGVAAPGTIGSTLRIGKSPQLDGDLVFSWDKSCSPGAGDYAIYEGDLASTANPVARTCTDTNFDRVEDLTPGSDDHYYLVVPIGPEDEGSHGIDSEGTERPLPPGSCLPVQSATICGGD